jgi:hypothetical protein
MLSAGHRSLGRGLRRTIASSIRPDQLGGHPLLPQQRNRLAIKRHKDIPAQPLPLMGDHPIGEISAGFQ